MIALAHDDDARTQTLVVELRVEPGCAYELVSYTHLDVYKRQFQVIALAHDDDARTQTLVVELRVEPGCAYELAEPLLVAVPRPLDGVTLRVEVRGP